MLCYKHFAMTSSDSKLNTIECQLNVSQISLIHSEVFFKKKSGYDQMSIECK